MPKAKVDKELLLKVAANSRLKLTESEIKKFLPQLSAVLDSFSKLDSLDVSKEEPSFQPVAIKNVFREDKAGKSISQDAALSNTTHKKDGYFKGPRVV
ncbi:MAG TPA: Asp-tRNA(Asn)/Glu-tRNA(Gln) amidotransferase subunit GatC [archaeon]|nr:Asp-tRNA(Asn)/Glu-tRNA(Gln) amidotransferase subunit GatC [archaeon]